MEIWPAHKEKFMKHTLLKTTAVLAVAALSTEAFAEPKISGRIYFSALYDNIDTKKTVDGTTSTSTSDRTTLNSAGSRIRFTGSEKFTDKTDLEYRLEYGVKLDDDNLTKDGKSNNFFARNAYLGLKHKDYGALYIGRIYTPDDDIDYVASAYLYSSGADVPFSYYGQRTNNTIQYVKPFNNDKTQVKFHYAMDEDINLYKEGTNNNGGETVMLVNGKTVNTKRDLAAAHILHEGEKFDAGLAYTHAGDFNAIRGMFNYRPTKELSLGIMSQQVDYNSGNNELGTVVAGYYKINDTVDAYVQAGYADNHQGWKDAEKTTASIGAIKWLKKDGTKVRTFASLSYVDKTSFALDANNVLTKTQNEGFGVETGLRIDF